MSWSYDELGRTLRQITPVGTTRYSYEPLQSTETNANGVKKDYGYDIRGNLTQVTEYLNNQPLVTRYQYSPIGKLSQMVDTLGNIRNIKYNGLNQVSEIEDIHANGGLFTSKKYQYNDL